MAYDNTNSGILFVNKDRTSDKHPNFSGHLNVEGKEYDIAAWTKPAKDGTKFLSISIEEKRKKKTTESKPVETPKVDELDALGDIPF